MKDFWRQGPCICFMFLYYIIKYSVISQRETQRILIECKSPPCIINICWLTKWLSEYSWPNHKKAAVTFFFIVLQLFLEIIIHQGEYIYARWVFFNFIYIANTVFSQVAISHWFLQCSLLKPSVMPPFLIPIIPDIHFYTNQGTSGAAEVRLTPAKAPSKWGLFLYTMQRKWAFCLFAFVIL